MARGTLTSVLLTRLKAELGYALEDGLATAEDARLTLLLDHTQKWLMGEYDWPFLKRTGDVLLAVADRTATLPATLDMDRSVQVSVFNNNIWLPLTYGITAEDFSVWNSDAGAVASPIIKWQYASNTTFEVWPRPSTATTVRFTGMKLVSALTTGTDVAELDDQLIVLYAAADIASGQNKPDAPAKLARAQTRFKSLTAAYPKPFQTFKLGGGCQFSPDRDYMGGTVSGGTMANTAGGTYPLASGVSSGTVVFNLGGVTPLAVNLTVQAPAGGLVLTASLDGAATSDGFAFNLSGATDSTGYSLIWEVTLQ